MKHRLNHLKHLCTTFIIAAVLGLLSSASLAASTDSPVIRVGYTELDSMVVNEDGTLSGYVADYLAALSQYTGWEYEFIMGSWEECMERLNNGEIDLIGLIPQNDILEQNYLFSHLPMGHNYTTLYTAADRDICYQEYEKLNGHTVGIVSKCPYGLSFIPYVQERNISCRIKSYPSTERVLEALEANEIQFAALGNFSPISHLKVVGHFSTQSTHFMTGPGNILLMDQLNEAHGQLKLDQPELESHLVDLYRRSSIVDLHLTREERDYIASAGTIDIRMFGNRHPITYYEENEVKGILPDYLDVISELTGLKFNYIPSETISSFEEAALLDENSILLTSNTDLAAETGLIQSSPIMKLDLTYIKRLKDVRNATSTTFAVLHNMAFLQHIFPSEYTVLTYNTIEQCMDAVIRGEADMTVQYDLSATYLLQKPKYASNLVEWVGTDYGLNLYLYGTEDHATLFRILNKTQLYLTEARQAGIVSRALVNHTYVNQADDVLYQYSWVVLLIFMLLLVLTLVYLLRYRVRREEVQLRENVELQRKLWMDQLTGLYNREGFFANAREMIARLDSEAVIIRVNLCRFKQINELYGMENGDMILRDISSRLKHMSARIPMVIGRFSADHFYLCVAKSDVEKLPFSRQLSVPALSLEIGLTYGVYPVWQDSEVQINIMCDRADIANTATQPKDGQHIHYYSDEEHQRLRYEQMMEREMEGALQDNQFLIHIQPKYDVASEVIVGGEVLVRWLHPEHGLIPPYKFIDLFERNGSIRSLDYYVWEKCCQYLTELKQAGIPIIPLSINMSRAHFYGSDSISKLSELLTQYQLEPGDVELEITESLCAEEPDILFDQCRQLREMGFRIAMDDFGSGYSSLSTLKDIPIDTLKMDLRFLAHENSSDQADRGHNIVRSVIELAHTIGLDVVVEGLETREQRDFIREIGGCSAQGYYYARPMPTSDFTELLQSSRMEALCPSTSGMAANLRRERLRREQLQPLLELISVSENLFGYLLPEREGILSRQLAQDWTCPQRFPDLAEQVVASGAISPASTPQWMELFQAVDQGARTGSAIVEYMKPTGESLMQWIRFDTILDHEGSPLIAIFTLSDFHHISAQVDSLIAGMQNQAEVENRQRRENEKLLSIITQHSDRVVCLYDVQRKTSRVWNPELCKGCQLPRLCEKTLEQVLQDDTFPPESKDALEKMFRNMENGVSSGDTKIQVYAADGSLRWMDLLFSTICNDRGKPESALISYKDITRQYEHEMAYLRQFQSLSETEFSLGLMEVDLTMDRIDLQDSLFAPIEKSAVGSSMTEFAEHMITLKMQKEHWEEARTFFSPAFMIQQHESGNRLITRTWPMKFLSGKTGWVRFDVELITDIYSGHIRAYFRLWDITSLREKQLELQHRSERDGMTGLYNRSTTEDLIQKQLADESTPGIFVLLDLDRLKQINDGFGHSEGDKAISSVARIMKSHFRSSDIIGRIGGDEFVVYLPGAAKNRAVIAETLTGLLRKMSTLSAGEHEEIGVTCSIGCVVEQADSTYDSLYRQADKALYHVKKSGRNNFAFYSPEMESNSFVWQTDKLFSLDYAKRSESGEVQQLLTALSNHYHLILSCNLTENSYHLMQEVTDGIFSKMPTFGQMDNFVKLSMMRMLPEDAERFDNAVSRRALTEAEARGEQYVHINFPFQDFDGIYKPAECTSILYRNAKGDLCEFALIRWIR